MGFGKDNDMEPVTFDEAKTSLQKVDRVILDADSIRVLQTMSEQIQNQLGDLVHISQKELVNFLIKTRSEILTSAEVESLRVEHFDIVKALKKATSEAIRSKNQGVELGVEDILKILQSPGVKVAEPSPKARGRKKKKDTSPGTSENNPQGLGPTSRSKVAKNAEVTVPERIEKEGVFESISKEFST